MERSIIPVSRMHVTAIIAAGGEGRRLGAAKPKQLLDIGGRSMLQHSVAAFASHPRISDVVLVVPTAQTSLLVFSPAELPQSSIRVVAGGPRRQDSVANGFDAVSGSADIVLIHDAARPFVTAELIDRTIDAAAKHGAAIAALHSRDTVKRVRGDGVIVDTIPRDEIYLAQTPQGFRRDVLAKAIAAGRAGVDATDEAMLAEHAGYTVHVVEGDPGNVKITTAEDLDAARARTHAGGKPARTGRAGTGYDLHRLVEGRPLVIGGVAIPSERGALGHSDADVVCHAATDAILGAAGLGDIGRHFPDSDPRWKNANSLELLAQARAMVAAAGYEVGNLDAIVILEKPKIKNAIDEMRARIATALDVDVSRVSIKGKTNEGIDAIGRGEAIAAHAVALIRSRQ
jgi:2-C-methyl-D-erythritol 4-phosphate cytidylyltransferase / 2-C-methyl-D-erythritol 2,4-cyclodiphosphate synthase